MNQSQQNEIEATRPVVTSITMWDKDNYVNFSDTDSMTDYFHSYSLGINHLVEWITVKNLAQPAAVIQVHFGNNEMLPKYYKRLERLAKVLRYKIKTVEKRGVFRGYEDSVKCCITPYQYEEFRLYDASLIKEESIITQ